MRRPVPELLAPAGSLDAVRAALGNGADAIYLGVDRFNARAASSRAFDRRAATCRDLCVQKHPNVELTDPAGYVFPVATSPDPGAVRAVTGREYTRSHVARAV